MANINVEDFLKEFNEILLDEHREIVFKYQRKYHELVVSGESTSNLGTHYNRCAMSRNEAQEDPDNCRCQHIRFEFTIVAKLIKFYKRIVNKK